MYSRVCFVSCLLSPAAVLTRAVSGRLPSCRRPPFFFLSCPFPWKPLPLLSACLELCSPCRTPGQASSSTQSQVQLHPLHSCLLLVRLHRGSITLCGMALARVRGQSARLAQAPAIPAPGEARRVLWAERPLGGTGRSGNGSLVRKAEGPEAAARPTSSVRRPPWCHEREHMNPEGNRASGRCEADGRAVGFFKDTQLEGDTGAVFRPLRARLGLAALLRPGKEGTCAQQGA